MDPNDLSIIKGGLSILELALDTSYENSLQPPAVMNMIKFLITHPHRPVNPNLHDIAEPPIHFAIQRNDYNLALLLLTESRIKVDVDIAVRDGQTPLLRAMEKKNFNMIKLLLDAGANVYLPSSQPSMLRWTPFMFAVKKKKDLQMCKLLIDSGYDVNRPILDKYCSAVHLAAENDITILKYLVETCRADVFVEPQMSRHMLGDVINSGKAHNLEYLLQHGYQHRGNEIWWTGDDLLYHAVHNPVCITVLLRWGLNNAVGKIRFLDIMGMLESLYRRSYINPVSASAGSYIKVMKLLKEMYPKCLQKRKFIERSQLSSYPPEIQKFLMKLYEECKDPPHLTTFCRTKIFQQLGYNPVDKTEQLPLPRCLINFVQFREEQDLYVV